MPAIVPAQASLHRTVDVPAADREDVRMLRDDRRQPVAAGASGRIGKADAGAEWRMVHEDRSSAGRGASASRAATHASRSVQSRPAASPSAHVSSPIIRTGWSSTTRCRYGSAPIRDRRVGQPRGEGRRGGHDCRGSPPSAGRNRRPPAEVRVFLGRAVLDEVAGEPDEVRLRIAAPPPAPAPSRWRRRGS